MLINSKELDILKQLARINTFRGQDGDKCIFGIRAEQVHFAFKK